mgnify:CR=1 FL=1
MTFAIFWRHMRHIFDTQTCHKSWLSFPLPYYPPVPLALFEDHDDICLKIWSLWKNMMNIPKNMTFPMFGSEKKDGLNPAAIHAIGSAPAVLRKQTQGMRWMVKCLIHYYPRTTRGNGRGRGRERGHGRHERVPGMAEIQKGVCVSYIFTLTNLENIEANSSSSDSDENILETALCGLFYSL